MAEINETAKDDMMDKIRQLENLLWQQTHGFHPYTCGNDSQKHKPLFYQEGKLVCHDCLYVQPFALERVADFLSEDDPDKDNRAMMGATK